MNRKIVICDILQPYLRLRSSVEELITSYDAMPAGEEVTFDFSGVKFSSRSFMDEFYNKLIVERHARVTNMTGELARLLDAVEATQVPIRRGASSQVQIQEVENMDELTLYLNELSCL